jgi:hypothetical protein
VKAVAERAIASFSFIIQLLYEWYARRDIKSASEMTSPSGFGLHFPKFDAELYLPSVLQGILAPSSGPLLSWVREGAGNKQGEGKCCKKKR